MKRKERPLVDMKAIHIALVVLALVLVLLSLRSSEGFEEDDTIMIFKAEWCSHCKTAAPEFAKLMASSPISLSGNKRVSVRILDADQDKDAMAPYKDQVKGFPTILIKKGDKLIEYPGERKSEDVIAFAKSL